MIKFLARNKLSVLHCIFAMALLLFYSKAHAQQQGDSVKVIALFAHPDDETWIAGTLAKLADRGVHVRPVYVTSGDRGSDRSGRRLTGRTLAAVREGEGHKAVAALGLNHEIYWRIADGQTRDKIQPITNQLEKLIIKEKATHILTFHPNGITGNRDHKTVSDIATEVVKKLPELSLIYFAATQQRAQLFEQLAKAQGVPYRIKYAVAESDITTKVDVSAYRSERELAFSAHKTQFPAPMIRAFEAFLSQSQYEELIMPYAHPLNAQLLRKLSD